MSEIFKLGIADLSARYRAGDLTPSDATAACLERVEQLEPKLEAFEIVLGDQAREAADGATKAIASGHRLGPFHGVPFALKDLIDVEGQITTGGSNAYADRVASSTATIAKRLIAGGGILVGKTKTVEVAYGPWGTNQQRGTPWNPWDVETHRAPGGSSSGSGAATSAGLTVCAVGTDTGGSVRIPSSFCGLTGLKVTEGRLPLEGILPLSHTLDTPGPMCRSVTDAAIMYQTMDGMEPRQIDRQLAGDSGVYGAMSKGMRGNTLGALTMADREFLDPEVRQCYAEALARLEGLGAEVVEFTLPRSIDDMRGVVATLIGTEGYYHHGKTYENPANKMDSDIEKRIMAGKAITSSQYIDALRERIQVRGEFLNAMHGVSAIVTPTTPIPAPVVAEIDQDSVPSQLTRIANYLGFCALSLPMGLSDGGLPLGLQIMARGRHETTALRIGKAFENDFGGIGWPNIA
ncbi:MAG: amidase [Alphaproteobacteria bacterium]|nr:amidase [Alphaproteobacteria bacterium]